MSKIVGIDLGTTNSVIAVLEGGEPTVITTAEGSRLTLPLGFDARSIRLTGNVVGQAPFSGQLSHRGWRATEVRLPKLAAGHDVTVLAQAEVEL